MTTQLTKQQIDAIAVELSRYGLVVRAAPKPRAKSAGRQVVRTLELGFKP